MNNKQYQKEIKDEEVQHRQKKKKKKIKEKNERKIEKTW